MRSRGSTPCPSITADVTGSDSTSANVGSSKHESIGIFAARKTKLSRATANAHLQVRSRRGAPSSNNDRLNRYFIPGECAQIAGKASLRYVPPLNHISTNLSWRSITLP
jgi:hypothetical protein